MVKIRTWLSQSFDTSSEKPVLSIGQSIRVPYQTKKNGYVFKNIQLSLLLVCVFLALSKWLISTVYENI